MAQKLVFRVLLICGCLLTAYAAAQELYRWVDEKGSVHFTDNYHSIPEKYRSQAEKRILRPSREPSTSRPQPQQEHPPPVSKSQGIVVPFTRDSHHIIVEAFVNGRGPIKFILDTGANLTMIPRPHAQQLGIDPEGGILIPIGGIGGRVWEPVIEISSLKLGEAEVTDLDVAIQKSGFGKGGYGLLGIDYLGEFVFNINPEKSQLSLARKHGPYGGFTPQWWQTKFRFYYKIRKDYEAFKKRQVVVNLLEEISMDITAIERYLRIVDQKLSELDLRASRVALPREFRQ